MDVNKPTGFWTQRRPFGHAPLILALQRILPEGTPHCGVDHTITPDLLARSIERLRCSFDIVSLPEFAENRTATRRARSMCAITIDGGWVDVYQHGLPILQRLGVPATVFLPVDLIGTDRHFWHERLAFCLESIGSPDAVRDALRKAARWFPWFQASRQEPTTLSNLQNILLRRTTAEAEEFVDRLQNAASVFGPPSRAFLNWDEVGRMQQAGVSFGSHTLTHTLLTTAPPAVALRELEQSRSRLSDYLGCNADSLSYPWGSVSRHVLELVAQSGYSYAVGLCEDFVDSNSHPLNLPRFTPGSSIFSSNNLNLKKYLPSFHFLAPSRNGGRRRCRPHTPAPGRQNRRIRIGFVIDTLGGADWGGIGGSELQFIRLLHALDRRFFDPEIYMLRPDSGSMPFTDLDAYIEHVAPTWPHNPIQILTTLTAVLRRRKPDIVQTWFVDGTSFGVPAARIARIPCIVVTRRNVGHWESWAYNLRFRVLNKLADEWQCNSSAVADSLIIKEAVRPELITILPNALDTYKFTPAAPDAKAASRRALGLDLRAPVVVSVANLTPVKNHSTLVRAAADVHQLLSEARFIVVGEGSERPSLFANIERLKLHGVVQLAGHQKDVSPFLAAADIGVLTSTHEGSSNAVMEYMACGLPVVASDIPANRELLDNFLFPPGDSGALASALINLCRNDQLRAQTGLQNRARIMTFGIDAAAQRAQSYYARLASEFR